MTDQNGTTHQYTRDQLGRQVSDTVTALGSGVDGSVMRIDTGYDLLEDVALTTSYSSAAGGTANIVNQVADAYEPLAQVVNDLAARGATAVVLGCTEIPLGIQAGPADRLRVPVIDTIDALARAAIGWARG